jgi:hypothetical protein
MKNPGVGERDHHIDDFIIFLSFQTEYKEPIFVFIKVSCHGRHLSFQKPCRDLSSKIYLVSLWVPSRGAKLDSLRKIFSALGRCVSVKSSVSVHGLRS